MRSAVTLSFTLTIGIILQAEAQTTAVDPTRLNALTQSAPVAPRVDTLVSQGASLLSDEGRDAEAARKLEKLWPTVASHYPYLGQNGLLIRVPVYALKIADPSLPHSKPVGDASMVGAGASPAEAWATAKDTLYGAPSNDYVLSQDDSWFLWVTPGRNGWPPSYPSYTDATKLAQDALAHNY
jgi:hypothetical protein